MPSQSAEPALHVIEQMPPLQAGVPLAAEQTLLHAPQFVMFDAVDVSQPLAVLPSQFPEPALQVI
jgi:hypothetical protein